MNEIIKQLGHDLANNLTIVLTGLRKVKRISNSDEVASLTDQIYEKVMETSSLCNSYIQPTSTCFHLADYLSESLPDLNQIGNASIILTNSSNPKVYTVAPLLKSMLINIIKNSNEAQATQIKITVSHNSLVISDNGDGIKKKNLHTLKTTEDDVGGHGLGLASIRNYCESNNWTFILEPNKNEPGVTAAIYFS